MEEILSMEEIFMEGASSLPDGGPKTYLQVKNRTPNERATKQIAKKSKRKGSHDEEAIGVDDEEIYSDADSLDVLSDSSYDSDLAASSDSKSSCFDPEFDPDDEIVDETDEDDVPIFAYDAQDPCIDVGVVKANGPLHTCGSFNNCGDTMASNKWVVDQVVELLRDDPTLGPKELQDELKKKYKIEVPTDAGKGIEGVVDDVYGVEHRECMRHLWKNMKKFHGPLFVQNMWAAAKSFTLEKYTYHMGKIEEK
ncbi:hypothetical protein E2562_006117 [Oryza meyeriana var. granulata]|uniref:Transposase MuDR plant domain-containing protein n=1 Tax=Oryza meyeriana var. granulata TaxID=110450 RepID=A0A6G1EVN1_9ORYZ|nr:hypothetical protein E2562_006117 [Oryza meyeriana var. granulata]